jgi:hypothetical protein
MTNKNFKTETQVDNLDLTNQSTDSISKKRFFIVLILANVLTWLPLTIGSIYELRHSEGLEGLVVTGLYVALGTSVIVLIAINAILLAIYRNKNGSLLKKAAIVIIGIGVIFNVPLFYSSYIIDPLEDEKFKIASENGNVILDSATSYDDCKNISVGYIELNCVEKINRSTGDLEGCLQYVPNSDIKSTASAKSACIKAKAIGKKDPSICDMIKDLDLTESSKKRSLEICIQKSR